MKWLACIAAVAALLCGCERQPNKAREWMEGSEKLKVLCTTDMIGDIVAWIGGERIDNLVLIKNGLDPHSYELVKGDDEKLKRAEVIFYNGLGLEHGASLSYHLENHLHSFALGDAIFFQRKEEKLIVDGQIDPHVWMDVFLWAQIADPIAEVLGNLDPEGLDFYKQRAKECKETLLQLDKKIANIFLTIPADRRYLVTSHDAFGYFVRRYFVEGKDREKWHQRCIAPEGLAPEGQVGIMDLTKVVNHLCAYRIGVVFPESNVNQDTLKRIVELCEKNGHRVTLAHPFLYGDSMGGKGYIEMLEHNTNVIAEHLVL